LTRRVAWFSNFKAQSKSISEESYGEDHLSPSRPGPLSIEAGFGNVENGFLGISRSVYRALLESAGGYVEGHLREYAISCIIGSVYDKLLHTIVCLDHLAPDAGCEDCKIDTSIKVQSSEQTYVIDDG
jgi:hypothetical protein